VKDKERTSDMGKTEKKIIGLSKASYRGVSLYELPNSTKVGCFLGYTLYKFETLQAATDYIDQWYDLKKN
jgi:hypothetical protein